MIVKIVIFAHRESVFNAVQPMIAKTTNIANRTNALLDLQNHALIIETVHLDRNAVLEKYALKLAKKALIVLENNMPID
jgi:hypothetical protein